jgi:hypothetical protein
MEIEQFSFVNTIALISIMPLGYIASPILGIILLISQVKLLNFLKKRVATDRRYAILRMLPVSWDR